MDEIPMANCDACGMRVEVSYEEWVKKDMAAEETTQDEPA